MSISRSSSNGVPSNRMAGGKKSDSDGGLNSAAKLVTLSGLSRVRPQAKDTHGSIGRMAFGHDRARTIYKSTRVGSSNRQPRRTVLTVPRLSGVGDFVDSVTRRLETDASSRYTLSHGVDNEKQLR